MPLINLNRINRGGEMLVNSEHIVYVETEVKSTKVHMSQNLLFAVEETPAFVAERIEQIDTERIQNAIIESGLSSQRA